jgi:glycerol-3-phosphate dehydrogenase
VPTLETEVLVVGGGSTGAGVVRDAAMRGFSTALVERGDLATGTTGRFHGLLHSGGRYVVKDPVAARECVVENPIVRRIAADCVEDTGGLFVSTPWDDPAYGDDFLRGCQETGLPVERSRLPRHFGRNRGSNRGSRAPSLSRTPTSTPGSSSRRPPARPRRTGRRSCPTTACSAWSSETAR